MPIKINNQYTIKTPKLCKMLGVSRQTLWTWEKLGYFTPPRNTRGDRVFTKYQAVQIVKAFSPEGSGKWHFTPHQ